jgi:hypothetical protein
MTIPRRTWAALIIVVALTAGGATAAADHVFPDSTFRPQDNVNRQQFAAWMYRCGGRVASGGGSTVLATTSSAYVDVATVTLRSGATGGLATGGFVHLSGALTAETEDPGDAANCPCFVAFELNDGTSGLQFRGMVPSQETDLDSAITLLSGFRAVAIPPDTTRTFTLRARFADADVGSMRFVGTIQALYVPFGPDGDNTLAFEP